MQITHDILYQKFQRGYLCRLFDLNGNSAGQCAYWRVRHEVIPFLERKLDPHLVEHLYRISLRQA